jgi:hypothetical protein
MIWYNTCIWWYIWYDILQLTAIGLTPSGSSTVHINTHAVHRTAQWIEHTERSLYNNKNT